MVVSRLRAMRTITSLFLLLATCQFSFASDDTNIIAMSDWSNPVSTSGGHRIRGRMIAAYGRGAAFVGPWPETQVFMEFQNVSGAIGRPTQFYFDPYRGFRCEMKDVHGKTISTGGGGDGGGAGATWITLPYDSAIRLRANMYGYGNKRGDGLNLTLYPTQAWQIRAGDTNEYYLTGTFTVATPTNFVPKDFEAARAVWSGTLELPKMKITVPKP